MKTKDDKLLRAVWRNRTVCPNSPHVPKPSQELLFGCGKPLARTHFGFSLSERRICEVILALWCVLHIVAALVMIHDSLLHLSNNQA